MRLKDILIIVILTIIFSFLIFIAKNYFFGGREKFENQIIEEKYIEPIALKDTSEPLIIDNAIDKLDSAKPATTMKVRYSFVPRSFGDEEDVSQYRLIYDNFLNHDSINQKLEYLDVMFYKQKGEVRGRMQNQKVRLFGLYEMYIPEFLAVGIHEYAHFYDLYILKKENDLDLSDLFYDVSWEETTIMRAGQNQGDFVSGYAMTNKYEDFAESYTYYVLYNSDFKEKSSNSSYLKRKYDFFESYTFMNGEFKNIFLRNEEIIKNYYRDITKIDYSLQNFLQYLKN